MQNSHLAQSILWCQKQKNKLIYIDELKEFFRAELQQEYSDKKCYKLIYHLKNKGYLVSLKKDIFCVVQPSQPTHEEQLVENYYRQILYTHMQKISKKRYIGGIKALELHYANIDIPEQILIINPVKQSSDTLLAGKTIHTKTYTYQKNDLFPKFYALTEKKKIGKQVFTIACKELAMLEALFSYDDTTDRYVSEYIKKVLKKYEPQKEKLEQILKIGKHHTSINRFLELIKLTRPKLVEPIKQLIKKYSFVLSMR